MARAMGVMKRLSEELGPCWSMVGVAEQLENHGWWRNGTKYSCTEKYRAKLST